jgi:hypothetical protein
MWGNRLGWGISTGIVCLVVWAIIALNSAGNISGPTKFGRNPEIYKPLQFPIDPKSVVKVMTESCDSASQYKQAISSYQSDWFKFQNIIDKEPQLLVNSKLPFVQPILEGAKCSQMSPLWDSPETIINYHDRKGIDSLIMIAKAVNLIGSYTADQSKSLSGDDKNRKIDEAIRYHEAVFSLGYKLTRDSLVMTQFLAGIGMMNGSVAAITSAERRRETVNTARISELNAFAEATKTYLDDHITPLNRVLTSPDEKVIGAYAGDVFAIAKDAQEPMLRVEAILKLGRMRFDIGKGRWGDQEGARKMVKKYAEDPDPNIRAAGIAARDLTIEQYRVAKY